VPAITTEPQIETEQSESTTPDPAPLKESLMLCEPMSMVF